MARPRDPRCDTAILEATLELVGTVGLGRLTVDAIAAAAGCSKATIYRRWPNKEAIVLDAWREVKGTVAPADTGTLRGDLLANYGAVLESSKEGHLAAVLPQVAAAAHTDEALGEAYRSFMDERRAPMREVVRRAVARGELPEGVEPELVVDLIGGALMNRTFLQGRRTSRPQLERWIDVVLAGLRAESSVA